MSRASFFEFRDHHLVESTQKWVRENETWLLVGGGLRPPRLDPLSLELIEFSKKMPQKDIYILHNYQKDVPHFGWIFEREVGLPSIITRTLPSTGFYTMTAVPYLCENTTLYGASPPNMCDTSEKILHDKLQDNSNVNLKRDEVILRRRLSMPYHYWQETLEQNSEHFLDECSFFNSKFGLRDRGHKFLTEHAIYQRWSKYRNITFRIPTWT